MRRALRPLSACVLAIFLVVLVTGIGSAQEESSSKSEKLIVRPGESIQAAVDVAKPGDTIRVIGGVHHESVVII
jgi:cell division protein FtsN